MERFDIFKKYIYFLIGIPVFSGLYLISLQNYLLFHGLVEIFSIVIACGMFMIAWNSRRFLDNNYLLLIGIAYLFVGAFDLIHTLTYKGMGIFQGDETNLPTQLWIAARYFESLSFLIAPFFLRRELKINFAFLGYTAATSLLLMSIFYWEVFPVCFIEGVGLTPFKKISEYIISLILLGAIILLVKNRNEFDRGVLRWIIWSVIVTIASELAFTFYIHPYGFYNLVGHYLKVVSFYLIYKAIIETGLRRPYDLLFRDLKQSEEALRRSRDELEIRVQERTAELVRTNEELTSEIAQRMRTEDALRKLTQELSDRVKEINCLYSVCYYVEKQYSKLEEKLQSIANLIPSGWQYPEMACARIVVENKEYKTENFKKTPWKQVSEIIVHGERIGTIEVYYLEEKPASEEGPFLKEERRLINAIAVELGEMIGHMKSDIALTEQSRILEAFFTSTITPLVFLDRNFNFVRVNQAYAKACQREVSEFPGHNHFEFYPSDAKAIFEQVVETKKPYQAIARPFTFPDHPEWGKTYWDWTLTPILDDAGEVEYLVFSLQDVTERKGKERELSARVRQQAAIAQLSQRALAVANLNILMDEAVTIIAQTLEVEFSKVLEVLPDGSALLLRAGVGWREGLIGNTTVSVSAESQAGYTLLSSRPVIVENLATETRFSGPPLLCEHGVVSGMSVIIQGSGRPFGVLGAHTTQQRKFTQDDINFLQAAANVLSSAIERKRTEEALRESENRLRILSSRLLTVQENERKRVAREIHDGIGQMLTAIKFKVEDIIQQKDKGKAKIKGKLLETIIPLIQGSIEEVRRIQMDLRPSILDDLGILATLNWFCREYQTTYPSIWIEKQIDIQEDTVPDSLKTVIYRISQEALNNITKHSNAYLVLLSLRKKDNSIELTIQDNGKGFDPEETPSAEASRKGLGLTSMRERAELSGGSFNIESAPGKGTIIRASWPL